MGSLVTVFTPDVVGARMAGPGIRAYHLARELSRHFETVLIASFRDEGALDLEGLRAVPWESREAEGLLRGSAVVIGQPHRDLLGLDSGVTVVWDLFDPVILELDELRSGLRGRVHRFMELRRLVRAILQGGALIVAAPAQRELYDRISRRYGHSIGDSRWLNVPFGVPEHDPPSREKADPPTVVWNGGVWPWLDPGTAIEAIELVNHRGTAARLSFMGTGRPNREVAAALGVTGPVASSAYVDWNPDWVPYDERAAVLGEAMISLMLHGDTEEARYSIRTRLFDAIWCGLPVVATRGGYAAELVEGEGLGIVVPPSDVERVADAIERIIRDDALRARSVSALMGLRERFRWSNVCRPLIDEVGRLLD